MSHFNAPLVILCDQDWLLSSHLGYRKSRGASISISGDLSILEYVNYNTEIHSLVKSLHACQGLVTWVKGLIGQRQCNKGDRRISNGSISESPGPEARITNKRNSDAQVYSARIPLTNKFILWFVQCFLFFSANKTSNRFCNKIILSIFIEIVDNASTETVFHVDVTIGLTVSSNNEEKQISR